MEQQWLSKVQMMTAATHLMGDKDPNAAQSFAKRLKEKNDPAQLPDVPAAMQEKSNENAMKTWQFKMNALSSDQQLQQCNAAIVLSTSQPPRGNE